MQVSVREGCCARSVLAIAGAPRVRLPRMDRFRRFDEAYYHRFYESPKTRVTSPEEHAHLAQFVFSFARWNHVEVKTVLDIGAGIGTWKYWIEKNTASIDGLPALAPE